MEINEESKVSNFSQKNWLKTGNNLFNIKKPVVMGILNITPDSFFDGGKNNDPQKALKYAVQMKEDGADIIDVGGYSSRPGAKDISVNEELDRVIPVIELLVNSKENFTISIDTFRSEIAREAIKKGAHIINDISAGELDNGMFDTVVDLKVPYAMMHMKGSPQNMQDNPTYENVTLEVIDFFTKKISWLRKNGVSDLIIDPGFGFGKTLEHNYQLLNHLSDFNIFELPILIGVSRKSMINQVLETKPVDAKNGGTVLHTIALLKGAKLLRTHDVKEAKEAIKIVNQLQKS